MKQECDIAVVGGGAAGLAAALSAARTKDPAGGKRNRGARIVVLDSSNAPGTKLLLTGGGRCNITHDRVRVKDFHGRTPVIRNILRSFDETACAKWFTSMGIKLASDPDGKVFPASNSAREVRDVLVRRCRDLGVRLEPRHMVDQVVKHAKQGARFAIHGAHGTIHARRVILATGGRSFPKTGSDGSGFEIARRLGHSVTATFPALVPLVLAKGFFHRRLSGIALTVEISAVCEGKLAERRIGELLWTHFGASGPVVMDMSRHWGNGRADGRKTDLLVSFFPGEDFAAVKSGLAEQAHSFPRRRVLKALSARLPRRVCEGLLGWVGLDPQTCMGALKAEQRRCLIHALTSLALPIVRDRGWDHAEITAGGVPLEEIRWQSMASRRVEGLYLAGEMLDCDGCIGGYNLHWAWATGIIAGRSAAAGGDGRDPIPRT